MTRSPLRAKDVRQVEGLWFNIDRTRLCVRLNSELACYRGAQDWRGEWHGKIVGIAADDLEAQRFLDGAFVELRQAG